MQIVFGDVWTRVTRLIGVVLEMFLGHDAFTVFYRGTFESILSSCFTVCTVSDHRILQQRVRTTEKIISVIPPSITYIYTTNCIRKATKIMAVPTHPLHTLFTLLPSGNKYCSTQALTARLCNNFTPKAIRLTNERMNTFHQQHCMARPRIISLFTFLLTCLHSSVRQVLHSS